MKQWQKAFKIITLQRIHLIIATAMVPLFFHCGTSDSNNNSNPVTNQLQVCPDNMVLFTGEKSNIFISGNGSEYEFNNDKPNIVQVNAFDDETRTFELEGLAKGDATITVKDENEETATIDVTVEPSSSETNDKLQARPDLMNLEIGDEDTIVLSNGERPYNINMEMDGVEIIGSEGWNPEEASLDSDEFNIQGNSEGEGNITIEDNRGRRTEIKVNIFPSSASESEGPLQVVPNPVYATIGGDAIEVLISGGQTEGEGQESYQIDSVDNMDILEISSGDNQYENNTLQLTNSRFNVRGLSAGTATITVSDTNDSACTVGIEIHVAEALTVNPTDVNISTGDNTDIQIENGHPPYMVKSICNSSAVTMEPSLLIDNNQLNIKANSEEGSVVEVSDSSGLVIPINVNMNSQSLQATPNLIDHLYIGKSTEITVSGGKFPYTLTSICNSTAIKTNVNVGSNLSENKLLLTGVSSGPVRIVISDENSDMVNVDVTIEGSKCLQLVDLSEAECPKDTNGQKDQNSSEQVVVIRDVSSENPLKCFQILFEFACLNSSVEENDYKICYENVVYGDDGRITEFEVTVDEELYFYSKDACGF
ncbi:MAG: hypothetical protein PVI90_06815 [Desulfobacteraceae bacterium]|jgi:hypothetical protein